MNCSASFPLVLMLGLALGLGSTAGAESPHTPKPGSAERQAICDAARAHTLARYATRRLPQAIVFKIDRIVVLDGYANLEAIPLFKDGSYVAPNYLPDIAFNFCLRKEGSRWEVIADLSRTDVPDAMEAARLRRSLPADFPLSVLSPDWRKILER